LKRPHSSRLLANSGRRNDCAVRRRSQSGEARFRNCSVRGSRRAGSDAEQHSHAVGGGVRCIRGLDHIRPCIVLYNRPTLGSWANGAGLHRSCKRDKPFLSFAAKTKIQQWIGHNLWWNFCQCSAVPTPPAPAPLAPPSGPLTQPAPVRRNRYSPTVRFMGGT